MNLPTKLTVLRLVLAVVVIVLLCFPFYALGLQFPVYSVGGVAVELQYIIAGIVFVVGGVFTAIVTGAAYRGKAARGIGIATAVLFIFCLIFSCMANVPTGHTGVLTTFGKVENHTLEAGMNFKAPWQSVVTMDNRVQKQSTDLICFSSDIQEVSMKYTVNYQISSADAMTIYKTIGIDYYTNIISNSIMDNNEEYDSYIWGVFY